MAATFAQTAEHAGKLGMGKSSTATAFYGALSLPGPPVQLRLCVLVLCCVLTSAHCVPADKAIVVHASVAPLVLTMLADTEANVGLLLDAVPRLIAAAEPMRAAFAATAVRAAVG